MTRVYKLSSTVLLAALSMGCASESEPNVVPERVSDWMWRAEFEQGCGASRFLWDFSTDGNADLEETNTTTRA